MNEIEVNTTADEDNLDRLDYEALERAMKLASSDQGRRGHLESKLQSESWIDIATLASYRMQCKNLQLQPWEYPPCWGSEKPLGYHGGQREAWELCKRLLDSGLSRWEPDPEAAIAAKRGAMKLGTPR